MALRAVWRLPTAFEKSIMATCVRVEATDDNRGVKLELELELGGSGKAWRGAEVRLEVNTTHQQAHTQHSKSRPPARRRRSQLFSTYQPHP